VARFKAKYLQTLQNYVMWIPAESLFLRPVAVLFASGGPTAAEWMKRWESEGVKGESTSEPEILQRFHQGKCCRDWHISEWKEGVRDGLFIPEEFIGSLGLTAENFAGIFGRQPDPSLLPLAGSMIATAA
jgi:hypothetical protein